MKDLRIPYQGSKSKIAYHLIEQMKQYKPKARYFYDLFGGGASMSFTALQMGYKVIYNEYDADLSNFIKFITDRVKNNEKSKYGLLPEEYYKFVTKETFDYQKKQTDNYSEFCRIVYSFGNDRRSYSFAPDKEKIKQLAHNIIVYDCIESKNELSNILGVNIPKIIGNCINNKRLYFKKIVIQSQKYKRLGLQQLEQLEQLQQLERLEQLQQLERLQILNKSYDEVKILQNDEDTIIYCDPPYRNTKAYRQVFDVEKFDKWVLNNDKTIFISEYNSPFYELFNINKQCTMSANNNNNKVIEKLYSNKNLNILGQQTLF